MKVIINPDKTFFVKLTNGTEVTGDYRIQIMKTNYVCNVSFLVMPEKQSPEPKHDLEQGVNFIDCIHAVQKKLCDNIYAIIKNNFQEHDLI